MLGVFSLNGHQALLDDAHLHYHDDAHLHSEYSRHLYGHHKMKVSHQSFHSKLQTSSSLEPYRHRSGKHLTREYMHEDVYTLYHIRDSSLLRWMLCTRISKDYISTKMILDNYDGLANSMEHVYNIHGNLELVIQDSYAKCKILSTIFRGSVPCMVKKFRAKFYYKL